MAGTCCPIETEPRTLSQGQINRAREVAADVAQKVEASEAFNIFTEGVKPVDPIKELVGESKERCSGKPPLDGAVENQKKVTLLERPCQCVCGDEARNLLAESPDNYVDVLKEPLSAPF